MLAVYFNMLASAIGKLYCFLVIVYGEHCVQTEKKNTHFSACFFFSIGTYAMFPTDYLVGVCSYKSKLS